MTSGFDDEFLEEQGYQPTSSTPTLLGIEFTPVRFGLLIGVLGLLGAGLWGVTQARPLISRIEQLESELTSQRDTLSNTQNQIQGLSGVEEEIEQGRVLNEEVSRLLANPENLQTQLLEISRLVEASAGELESFSPSPVQPASETELAIPEAIAPQLQVQTTEVTLETTYVETIALMNSIERLQTLLQVNNLSVEFQEDLPDELLTQFSLVAYVFDPSVPLPEPEAAEGEGEDQPAN